jgi:hypothetical protein
MSEPRAQRTLVKSPPELWAEVSDVSTLARHLGEFGEIRITRLEAETTVVWEGDRARGTVELEASGWGTKVTITAEAIVAEEVEEEAEAAVEAAEVVAEEIEVVEAEVVVEQDEEPEPVEAEAVWEAAEVEPEPEPEALVPEPEPEPRRGFFARLLRRRAAAERLAALAPPALAPPTPAPDTSAVAIAIREPEPEPVAIEPEIVPTLAAPEPEPEPIAAAVTEPVLDGEIAASAAAATPALDPEQVEAVLVGVLDDLGSAHHRPFSRG